MVADAGGDAARDGEAVVAGHGERGQQDGADGESGQGGENGDEGTGGGNGADGDQGHAKRPCVTRRGRRIG